MARTTRRNKPHLISSYVGSFDEFLQDPWWLSKRYHGCTMEQAYAQYKARYTRDHRSGRYGVPHWFRRLHGSKDLRLCESHKLHCALRSENWESHLPDSRRRNAKWYWW